MTAIKVRGRACGCVIVCHTHDAAPNLKSLLQDLIAKPSTVRGKGSRFWQNAIRKAIADSEQDLHKRHPHHRPENDPFWKWDGISPLGDMGGLAGTVRATEVPHTAPAPGDKRAQAVWRSSSRNPANWRRPR